MNKKDLYISLDEIVEEKQDNKIQITEKKCAGKDGCGKIKPISEFRYKKSRNRSCYHSICRECEYKYSRQYRKNNKEKRKQYHENNKEKIKEQVKQYRDNNKEKRRQYQEEYRKNNKEKTKFQCIKRSYGISQEQYLEMLANQNNRCKICNIEFNNNYVKTKCCVDHCHKTGKVRDLLCQQCNLKLGNFNDDIATFQKFIYYLNSHL